MPENIPFLIRAQRLAAIGAALPVAPDARPLSPSGLRALLKNPLVSGEYVRGQEDPYEDVYVEEVAFHGGPSLVMQGLTSHSAHTARMLLNAIVGPAGNGLPRAYVDHAGRMAAAALTLSDAVCRGAGLKRGTMAAQAQRREPLVPGAARLTELREAVTFTLEDLTSLLSDDGLEALQGWITDAGVHRVDLDSSVTDDGLILRPLLRHGATLIVANPGELMSALRHHLIVTAADYGCRDELAIAFRRTAAAVTGELLSQI
jgi:hypothetical protein